MTNQNLVTLAPKPIHYTINSSELAAAKIAQEAILSSMPNDIEKLDIEAVKTEKRKVVKFRTSIEKERKEYKSGALAYGELIDTLAKEAQTPVNDLESVYDKIIADYDAHFIKLAVIASEKEEKRIYDEMQRIDKIQEQIRQIKTTPDITPHAFIATEVSIKNLNKLFTNETTYIFDFQEFIDEAKAAQLYALQILNRRLEGMIEAERQYKINEENRLKFEAEKAAFAAEQKAAQDKMNAERELIQKAKFEAEREEHKRLQKIEDAQRAERQVKEDAERAEQKKLEDEKREKEKEELHRQHLQIVADREAREKAQAAEDRMRNAAPMLLDLLERVVLCDGYITVNFMCEIKEEIKLAKGE